MSIGGARSLFRGPTRPTIHYYGVCWNEEYILPHFLAHHRRLFDKIVLVDDGSTDGTLQLLAREPKVEVRPRQRPDGTSYIELNTDLYNQIWKESRGQADWVVVGNLDEFTYCSDLPDHLARCAREGVTVVPALGFDMVSRTPIRTGQNLLRNIRSGAPSVLMCRFAIFNPDAIEEIAYLPGRHVCAPQGDVVVPAEDRVLNLHYKYVGLERTFQRLKKQDLRRSESDREARLGVQYGWSREEFQRDWETHEAASIDVFDWYQRRTRYPLDLPWRAISWRGVATEPADLSW